MQLLQVVDEVAGGGLRVSGPSDYLNRYRTTLFKDQPGGDGQTDQGAVLCADGQAVLLRSLAAGSEDFFNNSVPITPIQEVPGTHQERLFAGITGYRLDSFVKLDNITCKVAG